MDKSKVNFFIDALMFLVMTALAGLGLLIKYVLVPGREAWAKYGRKMELTWLGLDRHAWGEVHLYLAFLLLGLLVVHIILHWRMILGLLARCISQPASRLGMASIYLVVAMALLALPLIVTPEVNEMGIRSDLGLEAPSSGIEGLPLSAANLETLERERHLDPAGETVSELEWTKEGSQVKVTQKNSHVVYWPKPPKYQTIYPLSLPEDNVLARSQKSTSTLLACCEAPRRRSP